MANNLQVTEGSSGKYLATLDESTVHTPKSLVVFTTAGVSTAVTSAVGLPVNVLTSVLPTGAALEAGGNLATIAGKDFATQTTLAAINGKLPSLGQALAAASVPVILPAATITTLTPPAAITGFALEAGGNLETLAGAVTSSKVQANVSQINGTAPSMGNGVSGTGVQRVTLASDSTGQVVLAAGTATVGSVGTVATTSGGWTLHSIIAASSTNATSVKASAGQLGGFLYVFNFAATLRYLKFYDTASAPTAGSGTPVWIVPIPPSYAGVALSIPAGLAFSTGIGYTIVTGLANSDATAVTASDVVVSFGWK